MIGELNNRQGNKHFLEKFNNLDETCKLLIVDFMKVAFVNPVNESLYECLNDDAELDNCESPIEKMFYLTLLLANHAPFEFCNHMYFENQTEIKCIEHNYRVDFIVGNSKTGKEVIVECDGHDFHEKTKEQVIKNNQRDYELKMSGYDVLHFSGSEIYASPMECVFKVCKYLNKQGVENEGKESC